MHATARRLVSLTTLSTVVAALAFVAPAAQASGQQRAAPSIDRATVGLFGHQDPTYDGVYRQSLSLIALDAAGARVPKASVKWLLRQQCGNGRFPAYSDLTGKCGTGEGDATAMATIALKRIGLRGHASAALSWLIKQQMPSGGWEFNAGFGENANTTALAVQAMLAMGVNPSTVKTDHTGLQFLRSLQLRCSADVSDRGALDYQAEVPLAANDYASAQATQALAGTSLPVKPASARKALPALTCPKAGGQPSSTAIAAGYLGRTIKANGGAIPYAAGGRDLGSTANAVLSLVAAGHGSNQIDAAVGTLKAKASKFSRDDAHAVLPGSSAALALAAIATDRNPRHFGGVNPIKDIQASRRLAG